MRTNRLTIGFLGLLAIFFAEAQSPTELTPLEKKQLTILSEPATLYKGFFRVGFFNSYNFINRSFDSKGNMIFLRQDNTYGSVVNTQLDFLYGISDRLQVGVLLPYSNLNAYGTQIQQVPLTNEESVISVRYFAQGVGDLTANVAYQILEETNRRPALTFLVTVGFPTGESKIKFKGLDDPANADEIEIEQGTGAGRVSTTGSLGLRKVQYPFLYTARVDYIYLFKGTVNSNGMELDLDPGYAMDFYIGYGMHLNDWITLSGDLNYRHLPASGETNEINVNRRLLAINPLLSFQIQRFRVFQLISIPFDGKNISADTSYGMKVVFTL